jgi:pimeloyl-ACP methyl ester carboxylesterase
VRKLISKKGCLILCALLVLAGVVAWHVIFDSEPPDIRFNGAYRLDDGRLVMIVPREGEVLRYRLMSGQSSALWPVGDSSYESGPGWAGREPVELQIDFEQEPDGGGPTRVVWQPTDGAPQQGRRIDLPEILETIPAGDLMLRGKLVLPLGEPPFPVVVLVHGSGKESAVDTYFMQYLFAAHGVAVLAYDKRGTGGSTGTYNQNFHLLSDDTVAVVEWLRSRPEVEPDNIHLAGYSQGGWIAPLAASKSDGIRSLLINYGPMVPITEEDRWGYRYVLQQKGFGEDALAEADRVNAVLGAIVDHGEDRWDELDAILDEVEGEPWFEAIAGSDSMLGFVADTKMPLWMARLYYTWMTRGDEVFVDRLYDPYPTMATLETPSLWIFGGEDSSMPTGDSIDKLNVLREAGRPIEVEIFPEAEHGILAFEGDDPFNRTYLGYSPGFLDLQVRWLREQSGLEPRTSPDPSATQTLISRGDVAQ